MQRIRLDPNAHRQWHGARLAFIVSAACIRSVSPASSTACDVSVISGYCTTFSTSARIAAVTFRISSVSGGVRTSRPTVAMETVR